MGKKGLKFYFKKIFIFSIGTLFVVSPFAFLSVSNNNDISSWPKTDLSNSKILKNNIANYEYDDPNAPFGRKKYLSLKKSESEILSYDITNNPTYNKLTPTALVSNTELADQLKNDIFNSNFEFKTAIGYDIPLDINPKKELTWKYASDQGQPSNVSGSLILEVRVWDAFSENGPWHNESNPIIYNINVIGFVAVYPTDMNLTVSLPKTFSNIFAQEAEKSAIDKNYSDRLINFLTIQNSPVDNKFDNFYVKSVNKISPFQGEIVLNIAAKQWYDENGLYRNWRDGLPQDVWAVTYRGFRKVPGATSFILDENNSIVAPSQYHAIDALDVSIQDLKNILFENIQNTPPNFTVDNIKLQQSSITPDQTKGEITISPSLNLYYDSNGYLKTSNFPSPIFKITGFKKINILPTTLPTTDVKVNNLGDVAPYQAINSDKCKEIMKANFIDKSSNLPEGFGPQNIFFTEMTNIDIDGTIVVNGYINYFYDNSLSLNLPSSNKKLEFSDLIFSGFKLVQPTVINQEVTIPNGLVDNVSVFDVNNDFISSLISQNINLFFDNIPNEFNVENNLLNLTIQNANAIKGEITIQFNINVYFVIVNGEISYISGTNKLNSGLVTIKGFKKNTQTKMVSTFEANSSFANIEPMNVSMDTIKNSIIFPNTNLIFNTLPPSFNELNYSEINIVSVNNLDGSITLEIRINLYYDSSGREINKTRNFGNLTITGFKKCKNTTFKTSVTVSDYSDLLPQDVTNDKLLEIININKVLFFGDIPSNFSIVSVEINEYNNITGVVKASLSVKNYYDQETSIINENTKNYVVVVKGFKTIEPTQSIKKIDVSDNTIFSSMFVADLFGEQSKLNDLFISYKNQIFNELPSDFSIENNFQVLEKTPNNIEGSIEINFQINYFYKRDAIGTLVNLPWTSKQLYKNSIIFVGFKKVLETTIQSKLEIPSGLYDDILPSDVTLEQLYNLVWIYRNKFIQNIPPDFKKEDMSINFDLRFPNNVSGTISIGISLYKYYDGYSGLMVSGNDGKNNPLTQNLIISGFKQIDGMTTITPMIDFSQFNLDERVLPRPSELTSQQIINLIFSTDSIKNAPADFNLSNIKIKPTSTNPDNINGTSSSIILINKYYDELGILHFDPNTFISFPITITGLKKQLPTKIEKTIKLYEFKNLKPSEITEDEILELIRENFETIIKNPTPTFKPDNITSFTIVGSPNNKLGQIEGTLTINNYFDDDGFQNKSGNTLSTTVLLTGFKTTNQTYANDVITLSEFAGTLPYDVKDKDITKAIYENMEFIYSNLPLDVSITDLKVTIDDKSNETGVVKATLNLYKYYNKDGVLVKTEDDSKSLTTTITINGFKQVSPTTFNNDFSVSGFYDILPSAVNQSALQDYLWNNIDLIVNSIPKELQKNNFQLSILEHYNNSGALKVKVSLSTYYDEDSKLIQNSPLTISGQILLTGFKKVQETTVIPSINLSGYSNTSLDSIDRNSLKDIIFKERNYIFFNLVNDTLNYNDFDVVITGKDNKTGIITASINLYKYYDEKGNIPSPSYPLTKTITISGFKEISPSQIVTTVSVNNGKIDVNGLPPPSEYVNSENSVEMLKNLITQLQHEIFINMPDSFNIKDNLLDVYAPTTQNVKANVNGSLVVALSINNYYDSKSDLKLQPLSKTITITGFNKIRPTKINSLISIDDNNLMNTLPQEVSQEMLKKFLVSKVNDQNIFYNLPSEFNENSILSIDIKGYDNLKGSLVADVKIKDFYDNSGILNTNSTLTTTIKFTGFSNSVPTKLNDQIISSKIIAIPVGNSLISPNDFETMSQSQIKNQFNNLEKEIHKLISNYIVLPDDKRTTVELDNYIKGSYNNQQGTIQINGIINNFINSSGNFVESQKVTFLVSGYKISNTLPFNNKSNTMSYVIYTIIGIFGVAAIACLVFFIFRYKKIRGIK